MLALVTVWRDGLVGVSKRKAGRVADLHRVYGVNRPVSKTSMARLVGLVQSAGYSSYGGVAWTVSDSMAEAIASGRYPKEQLPGWLLKRVEVQHVR